MSLQSSQRRAYRTRNKVKAVSDRPRLSVHRSDQHIYAQVIAKAAMDKGVKAVVFDRGSAKYHGRVKALADAAREGGLDF